MNTQVPYDLSQKYDISEGLPLTKEELDAEADTIKSAAHYCINEILERRAEMDRNGESEETLFVLIGENHQKPSHKILELLVLNTLQKHEQTTMCSKEIGLTSVKRSMFKYSDIDSSDSFAKALFGRYTDETLINQINEVRTSYTETAYTHKILNRFLVEDHNNPLQLCDNTIDIIGYIRSLPEDKRKEALESFQNKRIKELFENHEDISPRHQAVMNLRDQESTEDLINVSEKHKPRIIVHLCGGAHLVRKPDESYSDQQTDYSLLDNLPLSGKHTIGILSDSETYDIPTEQAHPLATLIPLEHLPAHTSNQHELFKSFQDNGYSHQEYVENITTSNEHKWTNEILRRLDLGHLSMNMAQMNEIEQCYDTGVINTREEWEQDVHRAKLEFNAACQETLGGFWADQIKSMISVKSESPCSPKIKV